MSDAKRCHIVTVRRAMSPSGETHALGVQIAPSAVRVSISASPSSIRPTPSPSGENSRTKAQSIVTDSTAGGRQSRACDHPQTPPLPGLQQSYSRPAHDSRGGTRQRLHSARGPPEGRERRGTVLSGSTCRGNALSWTSTLLTGRTKCSGGTAALATSLELAVAVPPVRQGGVPAP